WYAGRPPVPAVLGSLTMNSRKVLTASRFFEWLEAYHMPPPTLPVTSPPFSQVSGLAAPHWPAAALTLSGFWNRAPEYQAGPGIATRWSALATKSAPKTLSWVSVPLATMWSSISVTFIEFGSAVSEWNVSPSTWKNGASPD